MFSFTYDRNDVALSTQGVAEYDGLPLPVVMELILQKWAEEDDAIEDKELRHKKIFARFMVLRVEIITLKEHLKELVSNGPKVLIKDLLDLVIQLQLRCNEYKERLIKLGVSNNCGYIPYVSSVITKKDLKERKRKLNK